MNKSTPMKNACAIPFLRSCMLGALLVALYNPTNSEARNKKLLYSVILAPDEHGDVMRDWKQNKSWLYANYTKKTSGNDASHSYSQMAYYAQGATNNLLLYAVKSRNLNLLYELMDFYVAILDIRITTDDYVFIHVDATSRKMSKLGRKIPMWLHILNRDLGGREEQILSSSQLLYPITLIMAVIASDKELRKNSRAKTFVNRMMPIALSDHYLRWIFGHDSPHGHFQVKGWGCNPGSVNHEQRISDLLIKKYTSKRNFSYCNMVTDTDLWILLGIQHVLVTYRFENAFSLPAIDPKLLQSLKSYFNNGMKLLDSRWEYGNGVNFEASKIETAVFDAASWDDHQSHQYAGDTNPSFPGFAVTGGVVNRLPLNRPQKIGWDIAHSRRFVNLFFTLTHFSIYLDNSVKASSDRWARGFANKIAYDVFNGKLVNPSFSNYVSGINGWYRVNYNKVPLFGYRPSDHRLSITFLDGGYQYLSVFNEDISKISQAYNDYLKKHNKELIHQTPYRRMAITAGMLLGNIDRAAINLR